MHHVMGQAMSEDDVDDLLKEADIDGDGQLNYEGKKKQQLILKM